MLRFSYETLTNSWFYGEWIVKIIAKVMILIIHFVLHKKRRETMKDDKKEKKMVSIDKCLLPEIIKLWEICVIMKEMKNKNDRT